MFSSRSFARGANSGGKKRAHEASPTRQPTNGTGSSRKSKSMKTSSPPDQNQNQNQIDDDQKTQFTFEQVKGMLDALLSQDKKKLEMSCYVGLKQIDFNDVAVPGYSPKTCLELVDKLFNRTRRVRTTEEVLQDIRANLKKRHYTQVILHSGLQGKAPKRPPSAYLLFHQDKFNELKNEIPQAAEIAKIVSKEWETLDSRLRAQYQKRHDEMVKKYEREIKKLGLNGGDKPKRPKSAKLMYVQSKLDLLDDPDSMDQDDLQGYKRAFKDEYDRLDQEAKNEWVEMANEERKRFYEERQKFLEANPHLDPEEIIKSRKTKVKVKPPPPPRNACRIFTEKKLPEGLMGQELKDTEQRLRDKFNSMSSKKQMKYIKKAIKERDQYEEDITKFAEENPGYPLPRPKPNITKEQWKLYQSQVENKPTLPAASAYLHYCAKTMLEFQYTDQIPTQKLQAASTAWNNLSEAEKNQTYQEHIDSIKQYIEDMRAWLDQQDEKRVEQVFREDQKANPEYWRKRLNKLEKSLAKRDHD